jgi:hypothetical protein
MPLNNPPLLVQPIINGALDPAWQLLWRAELQWRTLVSAPRLETFPEQPRPEPTDKPTR